MIDSSWSPKESTGPVDFFRHFSSSLRASASSFPLASSFQNNPAACLADWCGFLPESGVVFAAPGGGRLDLVGVFEKPGTFWHAGTAVTDSTKDTGQLAEQLESPMGAPYVGNYLARKEDLVRGHVVHLLPKGTGHLQDGVEEGPGLLLGNMFLTKVHQLGMDVLQGLIGVPPGHS